ncbi:IclR family transcriptional regulator [Nocardia exalbida]|uniref:IclR family transcriptional regulator n=1 Tax=Nocardia exalbida TaxID=290231 RepID=UPI00031E0CCF|nr:IclR family transcriptional regulator [Nocardia exalbida]
MSAPASYPIESVDNAARILLMLLDSPALRVANVARDLGVARSTAHRMLTTLQARGLLRQDPATKTYGPGASLVELGMAVMGAVDLRAEIRPVLEKLSAETGETAHLLVLEGVEVVFLDGVEGKHVIRAAARSGQRSSAHTSAAGKALLAHLDPEELRRRYPGTRLRGGTSAALGTRAALFADLERIRERGYATNMSESEPDLHAVAVTVCDRNGNARFALSISGPAGRLGDDLSELGTRLRATADELAPRF